MTEDMDHRISPYPRDGGGEVVFLLYFVFKGGRSPSQQIFQAGFCQSVSASFVERQRMMFGCWKEKTQIQKGGGEETRG